MPSKSSPPNSTTQNLKLEPNFCLPTPSSGTCKRKRKDFFRKFNSKQSVH